MLRRKIVCFSLLILILSLGWIGISNAVHAEENNQSSEGFSLISDLLTIFPEEKVKQARAKGYEVKFAKYKPSQYNLELHVEEKSLLDFDEKISDGAYILINEINNFIWQALLAWNFTVILIVENAFSLDVVDEFADAVEKAVQELAGFSGSGIGDSGLFGNFMTMMIIIAGAWIAYQGMIKKKTTDAISGMLTSLLILMLGLVFFANAGGVMKYLNDISSGLSQEVMGVGVEFQSELNGEDVSYPSDISSLVVADKLYNMMVYEPYIMLQYAKTSSDPEITPERVAKILNEKPGSAARLKAVQDEKNASNPMVTNAGIFQRLTLILLLCVSHFILGLLFFIIAGAMIVYQFLFVLISLFAPFAFLIALNPAWSSVAVNWFKKLIGYQLIKLIVGVFFSMLLTISQFLYTMSPPDKVGYVWTIAMQLILVVGVIWKRDELFSIMKAPMGKIDNFKGDFNIQVPINYLTKYTQNVTSRIGKIRMKR